MVTEQPTMATETLKEPEFHKLSDSWTFWAHLPHDPDWSINSYKKIYTLNSVEEIITINETFPEILVKNCMLFLMREGIKPTWEDPKNRKGGCFSYKVSNKNVYETWKELSYVVVGNTASKNETFTKNITGITISPKKYFCIIKIWMSDCSMQNPELVINEIKSISPVGCLFKQHTPEY